MRKIAVFASGNGSNYEAMMEALTAPELGLRYRDTEVALLVSDKPEAYVIQRAQKWATPTFAVSPKDYASKQAYEEAILAELHKHGIEFIVLAGYMRLVGSTLLQAYMGRIINLHPSLLPAFAGKDAIGQALDYGVRVTGITIHYVDEGLDTGPIIYQQAVEVDTEETKESLTKKIQALEHKLYPQVILACLKEEIVLEGGRVKWVHKLNER